MTIGDRIKQVRLSKGITQEELAQAAHTIKQTICKYENNTVTNIPSDKIEAIADRLGVSAAYLMGWKETSHTVMTDNAEIEIIMNISENLNDGLRKRLRAYAEKLYAIQKADDEISDVKNGDKKDDN